MIQPIDEEAKLPFPWLVSPYYPASGGSVIDWMPADFEEYQ
jgi:hypothetical protein